MNVENTAGLGIGVLLLLQMAAALILSFVLMDAVRAGYPSFLETAAASAGTARVGVVISTLGAALTVWIAVAMFPRLTEYSRPLAMAFTAICVISATLDLVHNSTVLSMLAAGEQYTMAAGSDTPLYQAWGIASGSLSVGFRKRTREKATTIIFNKAAAFRIVVADR
ncbi:MAG: DUF4386 family protein [Pyrinomonadaceae bacterium]